MSELGHEDGDAGTLIAIDDTGATNTIVSAFGRKGSGKSTINRRIYRNSRLPKLAIDVNGNADPGPDALRINHPDERMPIAPAGKPQANLHYVVDPGAKDYQDRLDDAIGMSLFPTNQPTLVWAGEIGDFGNAQQCGPNLRRLLQQSRHHKTNALFDGPRPMNINPLVIGQADYVIVFDLPHPGDRARVAENIGMSPKEFDAECEEVFRRGDYWHLVYDANNHTIYRCPPV